ncbi:MAG: TatD family hydrolase [Clostridiales bacterium]|nr:TatD family hydrolase [Clostridiales bacterium]
MYFDTHAHYDDEQFDEDRYEVIQRVHEEGVDIIVNVGASMDTSVKSVDIANKYDYVYASVGVHPHEVEGLTDDYLEILRQLICQNRGKVVAVGEIGLDYYRNPIPKDVQKEFFVQQIDLARQMKLPVIIHDRDAHQDTLDVIRDEDVGKIGGIVHCFSGSKEMAEEVIRRGLYVAIGGVVTFKNAKKLVDVVRVIPEERLLIETDLPYLTPEPFRGGRNDSSYLKYIVDKIADIKETSSEYIAKVTMENAKRVYNLNTF